MGVSAPTELPGIPPKPRTRTGLLHPLAHYTGIYATSERGLKLWLADGRAANDPCPLDDPAALVEWWRRRKTWSVPDRILAAAAAVRPPPPPEPQPAAAVPEAVAPAVAEPPPPAPPTTAAPLPREAIDVSQLEGYSFEQIVAQLRQASQVASIEYARVLKDPNAGDAAITLKLKAVQSSADLLRKAEKDLLELQRERGDVVTRSNWERDCTQLLRALRAQHDAMAERIAELVPAEVREVVRSAVLQVRGEELATFRSLGMPVAA